MPEITDKTKLDTLTADWGHSAPEEMLEEYVLDSVAPAICMNPDCDYSTEMEPDQDRGWCEPCAENSMKSCFILMGVI